MTKFKHDIAKKNLSWETSRPIICDHEKCNNIGEFRAPKSRSELNNYYYFCLKHVSEYNKSWDFYRGLSVDEIELSMRKDTVWDRPSWPLKGIPTKIMDQLNEFIINDYSLFEKDRELSVFKFLLKLHIFRDNQRCQRKRRTIGSTEMHSAGTMENHRVNENALSQDNEDPSGQRKYT